MGIQRSCKHDSVTADTLRRCCCFNRAFLHNTPHVGSVVARVPTGTRTRTEGSTNPSANRYTIGTMRAQLIVSDFIDRATTYGPINNVLRSAGEDLSLRSPWASHSTNLPKKSRANLTSTEILTCARTYFNSNTYTEAMHRSDEHTMVCSRATRVYLLPTQHALRQW